jgi:hypothetical protein
VPDGQCLHFSQVLQGTTHDTAIFDGSEVVGFIMDRDDDRER